MNSFYLYIFFVITFFVNYGCSIKCHVCNSKENARCVDPFNISTTLQECEQGHYGGANSHNGKTLDVIEIIMQSLDGGGASVAADDEANEQKTVTTSTSQLVTQTVCQKIIINVGNETITSRGCSPQFVDGMHPCDAVKLSAPDSASLQLRLCLTCPSDACNGVSDMASRWCQALPLAVLFTSFMLYRNTVANILDFNTVFPQ